MLIELLEIERGLTAAGSLPSTRHRDIQWLANRAVLRARLGAQGTVTAVEVVQADDAPKFWTLAKGNHSSFPRIAVGPRADGKTKPLRPGGDKALTTVLAKEKPDKNERLAAARVLYGNGVEVDLDQLRLDAFRTLHQKCPLDLSRLIPWPGYRHDLERRATDLAGLRTTNARAVIELLNRIQSDPDGLKLLESLDSAIDHAVRSAPDTTLLGLANGILFIGGGEVLLDTDIHDPFPRSATDPHNVPEISSALAQSAQGGAVARCALSGEMVQIEDDKFPKANLPAIGPTYLYSKNKDTPCAARYGPSGPESFPVSRELLGRIQGAAEALVTEDREWKTWSPVPSEKPKKRKKPSPNDLLLAFVPALSDAPVAGGLAEEGMFEELSSRMIDLWKGQSVGFNAQTRFIVLRKADPGNGKVIFSASSSLRQLAEAAARWTEGCRNGPDVHLRVLQGKGKPAKMLGPPTLSPGSVVALGREVFVKGGTERCEGPGPTFADAMGLFLQSEEVRKGIALGLLGLFLVRRTPLIEGFANARRKGDDHDFIGRTKAVLETISVFALLLNTLGRKKEEYMSETAFQLGQLLAGADVLHRGYCEDQRRGSIPPTLLGNQALALAQRSPVAALSMLCRRWRVYAGWAEKKRVSVEQPRTEPKPKGQKERIQQERDWAVYRGARIGWKLRETAQSLHGAKLPEHGDDLFRAELLLGYIAGPQSSAAVTNNHQASDSKDQQED